MGEIFEKSAPTAILPWTGERLTTGITGQVEIEHLHRYVFARGFCRGKDVLDVASGEGYGSNLLAQVAVSVIGVEIDQVSVTHAQSGYGKPNLQFRLGDARALPLPDACVDVVVSFETIEHFYEHDLFINEIRRVLRPGGLLIISSPERDIYSPTQQTPNPYHVRELTRSEFDQLLGAAFEHVALYAQRPFLGAALVREGETASGPLVTFERRGETHFEVSQGLPRPLYWVAVASDAFVAAPNTALYIDTSDVESIFGQARNAAHEAASLRSQLDDLRPQAETWRRQLEELGRDAETWRLGLLQRHEELAAKEFELAKLHEDIKSEAQIGFALKFELKKSQSDHEKEVISSKKRLQEQIEFLEREAQLAREQVSAKEVDCSELRLIVNDLHRHSSHAHDSLAAASDRAIELESRLLATHTSISWRLTGPLRGIAARHPGLARKLNRVLVDYPQLSKVAMSMARVSWRLVTLRSPFIPFVRLAPLPDATVEGASPPALPGPAFVPSVEQAPPVAIPGAPRRVWFFLGDTIEWLANYAQLTGVGRVTAELFLAGLRHPSGTVIPCSFAPHPEGIASLSIRDSATFIAARSGASDDIIAFDRSWFSSHPPALAVVPTPGDEVLFTGVVWSTDFAALFRRLAARGIRLSVLVYDIIPLEHPEYVSSSYHSTFAVWLRTVLALAKTIFVSSPINRDKILRWAVLAEAPVAADVVTIDFGVRRPVSLPSPWQGTPELLAARLRPGAFVLSVGTIDQRKNQVLLCNVWAQLLRDAAVPATQLVLVGRDDIGIDRVSDEVASLVASGDILVLQGLSDTDLAGLYASCLFTCFTSLSEGHGLPVAESLAYGKVCITSDLSVIRDHAGNFAWYVPPGDQTALLETIRRALTDSDLRLQAEATIRQNYVPRNWADSWAAIQARHSPDVAPRPLVPVDRPRIPGVHPVKVTTALARADEWCTSNLPRVSIIILNWNSTRLTLECVRHIWLNTTGILYEIVIVDNGSIEDDPAPLRNLGRGVRLLELQTNRFFGEANNIGVENSAGELVCLLNSDAFVEPGWLNELVGTLDKHHRAGACGPLFLFPTGIVQEAGGSIDDKGYPIRAKRGETSVPDDLVVEEVDYVSAATLLVWKKYFIQAGGFSLTYEPAYYEDVDLCFKLRALGYPVLFCPWARVIHIEGASANDDAAAIVRRNFMGDLNRDKFTSRWSDFLKDRSPETLSRVSSKLLPLQPVISRALPERVAALFTPYALTPGGGERFLLSVATILSENYRVLIVTQYPYSQLRLTELGRELELDLSHCSLTTLEAFMAGPDPDCMVALGNHIVPPIAARAENSVFVCQFPFPFDDDFSVPSSPISPGHYRKVITYSEFARAHVVAALSAYQMPDWPVTVLHPPVPQHSGDPTIKRRMILTVGRFFTGAHSKRHDLMIEAFRRLHLQGQSDLEFHIAGSSTPGEVHMNYLADLKRMAAGLPITFHINVSSDGLDRLYRDAEIYWHATGLDVSLAKYPGASEHFGITVLEAMSAGCVPVAFNAGGPREIITHDVDGILFNTMDDLVSSTKKLLDPANRSTRGAMGWSAMRRAKEFDFTQFRANVREQFHVSTERPAPWGEETPPPDRRR